MPDSRVFAVDISSKALAVARQNAFDLGLEERINFVKSDLFENLEDGVKSKVDAIVSNPPYILSREIEQLMPEVRDFEPTDALDGGKDGLSVIKRIVVCSHEFLKVGGLLAIEVGYGQANAVASLVNATNKFGDIKILKDYSAIERIVAANLMKE